MSIHYEAIKKQGRRTDLIQEIENMVNASNINDYETSAPLGNKLKSIEKIGQDYSMAKNTVARYLRINKIINPLKDRLDDGELAIRAAVTLSYLSGEEQQIIEDILDSSHYKLDMKKADSLRTASEKKPLDHETVEQILAGTKRSRAAKPLVFKLRPKILSKYFKPEQRPDEIEAIITEALDFYYSQKSKKDGEKL